MHDVGSGGVGAALAEMAVRSDVGFTAARLHSHVDLFSESPSRVVLCVDPDRLTPVLNVLEQAEVPSQRIGVAGGDRLSVKGLVRPEPGRRHPTLAPADPRCPGRRHRGLLTAR